MADDIAVHFNSSRGDLLLTCGSEGFDRIRQAVCAVSQFESVTGQAPDRIRSIEVVPPPDLEGAGGLRGTVVWLGCTLFSAGILFVFGVGAVTVARWLAALFA